MEAQYPPPYSSNSKPYKYNQYLENVVDKVCSMEVSVEPRHRPYVIGLALYSGLITALTVGDRWAHHTFATSDFCLDPSKVQQAGYYRAIHRAQLWAAWKDLSQWWGTFWSYLIS